MSDSRALDCDWVVGCRGFDCCFDITLALQYLFATRFVRFCRDVADIRENERE